jgi:hypothetical protein
LGAEILMDERDRTARSDTALAILRHAEEISGSVV